MPIGSSTLRDSRRRRVLLEEKQESVESTDANLSREQKRKDASSSATPERAYTEAALVQHHPPVSSLVPKSIWLVGAIVIVLTAAIVLLNLLSGWSPKWAEKYGAQKVMAFDMAVGRGLVKWLSSFLLVVGAFYCMQVYLIRRHRNDDYRGTYRVWIWLAGLLLVASIDATAGFHDFVFSISREFAREQFQFDSKLGWLIGLLAPLFCLAARVLMEIRRSKGAVAAFLLATASFVNVLLLQMEFFAITGHFEDVLQCNSLLVGYMSLFLCTTCYARFVFLDSHGTLAAVAEQRAARLARKKAKEKEQEKMRADKRKGKEEERGTRKSVTKEKAAKAKPKTNSKPVSAEPERPAAEKKTVSTSSPLASRIKATKSKSNVDAARQIPTPAEKGKGSGGNHQEEKATISLEEMQHKLNESKSRSERKRLQKMMKREQRRAA